MTHQTGRGPDDAVAKNLLRLTLGRDSRFDGTPPMALTPEELERQAHLLGVTVAELKTPPEELAARLTQQIQMAIGLDSGEAAATVLAMARNDARRLGFPVIMGEVQVALARVWAREGRLDQAISEALGALGSPRSNDLGRRAEVAMLLARLFQRAGQLVLVSALSAAVAESLSDGTPEQVTALRNWGISLGQLGRYQMAVDIFDRCRAEAQEHGLWRDVAWAWVGTAACYAHLRQRSRAEAAAEEAQKLAQLHGWPDVLAQIDATRLWLRAASMQHVQEPPDDVSAEDAANWLDTEAMWEYRTGQYAACRDAATRGLALLDTVESPALALKVRLLWWRALAGKLCDDPDADLYRRWAEDLFRATLSSPMQQDLPPWPED